MIKIKNVKKMKSLHPKSYMSIILKNISKCNGFLLFNSLSKLQTKPLPSIRHICAFSRGVLNVRSTRSHPTLAPRPQICLIEGNGFCAVAGEGELNSNSIDSFPSLVYDKFTLFYLLKGRCPIKEETWFLE